MSNARPLPYLTAAALLASAGACAGSEDVGRAGAGIEVSSGDGYEIWTISGKEVYDLSDGEELSNILVDQSADGATLTIRARNKTDWTVENVGFLGVGQDGDGSNSFQFQVSAPSGGDGLIQNIWMSGKARDGLPGTKLGGIYLRASHAGHIDIRHTYIEGFGNNAVYGSAVGKDEGQEGSVAFENCYHRDNTVSQFRLGSPNSVVRNSVGVVDDPAGDRGPYPSSGSRNARGVWGKHFPNQRVENSSFYISPDDFNADGAFEARYIAERSRGPEAVLEVVDCDVNEDAPTLTGSTENATVEITDLGHNPTVTVIGGGGVPLDAEMAARGERAMPPENPGASGSTGEGGADAGVDPPAGEDDAGIGTDPGGSADGMTGGCAAAGSGGSFGGALFGLLALALVAGRRRTRSA